MHLKFFIYIGSDRAQDTFRKLSVREYNISREHTVIIYVSVMSSSESIANDTDYADCVLESFRYVAIYEPGTFSCSSPDDDDVDDVEVKRILAKYGDGGLNAGDCGPVGFSSAYKLAAAAVEQSFSADDEVIVDIYEDWDEALRDVTAVYPPRGASRAVTAATATLVVPKTIDEISRRCSMAGRGHGDDNGTMAGAREFRKCLEGALYGRDSEGFTVAQPYCVADKNLDFGKPDMSPNAVRESRKKVEDWMSKYPIVSRDDRTAVRR